MPSQQTTALYKDTVSIQDVLMHCLKIIVVLFIFSMILHPELGDTAQQALSDGFFQVSTFVAVTLLLYKLVNEYWQRTREAINITLGGAKEISFAACLGALPGCGGAIIVATQFTQGKASFSALVAVLCSTMGDAAFLLLAKSPEDGALVIVLGIAIGIISGLITSLIHPQTGQQNQQEPVAEAQYTRISNIKKGTITVGSTFWGIVMLPALVIAVSLSFQLDIEAHYGISESLQTFVGTCCALLITCLWLLGGSEEPPKTHKRRSLRALKTTTVTTNSVSVWVFVSFLLFEWVLSMVGSEPLTQLLQHSNLAPLIATAVGILPGCGPQIMVTNLYLQNIMPFSGQIANAVSNDGDALFPALAIAPRAALLATLYTMIPALLAGYAYFYWFEN